MYLTYNSTYRSVVLDEKHTHPVLPGVPEVLHITFSFKNQKACTAGRKAKYQHNLHLMAIQIKTEQSRKVII